jgi:Flp pilus assembly protein TadD
MQPHDANTWLKLARLLESARRWDHAEDAYRALLALRPADQQALSHLGYCLRHRGKFAEAEQILRQAIALSPDDAEALHDLGAVLLAMERATDAVGSLQLAVKVRPNYAEAYCTLAASLCAAGEIEQALSAAQRALALRPEYADAWSNLGLAHLEQGNLDQATAAYQEALRRSPGLVPAVLGLFWTLLAKGQYSEAWTLFETRRRLGSNFYCHAIHQPVWEGEPLEGQRVLVHAEKGNGFGEVIQMARFIPMVAARGGRVILECQPQLQKLLQSIPGVEQVVGLGQALPDYKLHCPLMSLPARFDITLHNIPAAPYIPADAVAVEHWRRLLASDDKRLKVGLVWSGRSQPPHRSIDPRLLSPLASNRNVRFFSLQMREGAGPDAQLRPDFELVDPTPQLRDFSDTAALLMNLDLLISIDTAAVHLAGALGRPAWLLVRHAADWRWLREGPQSPWYPTIRIFRQRQLGDWTGPIAEVAAALAGGTSWSLAAGSLNHAAAPQV